MRGDLNLWQQLLWVYGMWVSVCWTNLIVVVLHIYNLSFPAHLTWTSCCMVCLDARMCCSMQG